MHNPTITLTAFKPQELQLDFLQNNNTPTFPIEPRTFFRDSRRRLRAKATAEPVAQNVSLSRQRHGLVTERAEPTLNYGQARLPALGSHLYVTALGLLLLLLHRRHLLDRWAFLFSWYDYFCLLSCPWPRRTVSRRSEESIRIAGDAEVAESLSQVFPFVCDSDLCLRLLPRLNHYLHGLFATTSNQQHFYILIHSSDGYGN